MHNVKSGANDAASAYQAKLKDVADMLGRGEFRTEADMERLWMLTKDLETLAARAYVGLSNHLTADTSGPGMVALDAQGLHRLTSVALHRMRHPLTSAAPPEAPEDLRPATFRFAAVGRADPVTIDPVRITWDVAAAFLAAAALALGSWAVGVATLM